MAGDILRTARVLPIGFWKGAGLSMMLDILAVLVSGGDATCRIGRRDLEYGVSQVFLALDVTQVGGAAGVARLMDEIVADLHAAAPEDGDAPVRYPGERVRQMRTESREHGVTVDEYIWQRVLDWV